jgi:two-component system OmpR family sensor kinase
VRDHGPGISEDEASKVFERFYRADTSRTRETGGSGLGLAIVAAIVGSHGGSVRVEPTDGGGATLVVALPVRDEDSESPGTEFKGAEFSGADGPDHDGQDQDGGSHSGGRVIHI